MTTADIIIKSNAVFTVHDENPFRGGVAMKGNRIVAVAGYDDIDRYITEDTKVMEYGDNLVMPGLIDAHDHFWWGAVAGSNHVVDITDSESEEEAVRKIKQYADDNPDEKRIRGFGWYPSTWHDAPLPTKKSLDDAIPDRPVYMNCADAHTGWLNTKALEESGYYPGMKLGAGYLGMDEKGELNGLVHEPDALIIAWEKYYDFPSDQIHEITLKLLKGLARYGVTSVGEMSADDYKDSTRNRYNIFREMEMKGELTCRIHSFMKFMRMTDFDVTKQWQEKFNSDIFRISGVKGFLDGVMSTYTGYLLEPYEDRPDTCGYGVPLDTAESFNASVVAANAAGLPVRVHAIGDAAVRMALDAYECSIQKNGRHGLRNTVEHMEIYDPKDLPRFKELGVIASMQGEHLPLERNEKIIRVGEERTKRQWAFRSILDAGATLAFGTDYPVVFFNQFPGIYASITRRNYDGTIAGVECNEYITLGEALTANTLGSAKAYTREHELGTLETGKLADVIVLDRNLFDVPVEEIKDTRVLLTIMNGKIVYEA